MVSDHFSLEQTRAYQFLVHTLNTSIKTQHNISDEIIKEIIIKIEHFVLDQIFC